jgi:hypothetical protein
MAAISDDLPVRIDMFHSVEQDKRIFEELEIMRPGKAGDVTLCHYGNVSCVRCCLPHIGGDAYLADSGAERTDLPRDGNSPNRPGSSSGYLGPHDIVMKFKNFNPLKDPQIEASQYEDCFPDVGREEMERRFSDRRNLFLEMYDRERPVQSLHQYMKAAQRNEGYQYQPPASAGPASMFIGGSVSREHSQKGELPECQLLGFVDGKGRVGCMAHPRAEISQGYDGRDRVGFFHHSGCCESVGCEASREFQFLSSSAMKIFARAVDGMSWYEYSRHATSVLVYFLRGFDCILQKLDARGLLESLTLEQLVVFTNSLYDEWPLRRSGRSMHPSLIHAPAPMSSLDILLTNIPLAERIMYIALDTWVLPDLFAVRLLQARDHVERRMVFALGAPPSSAAHRA